MHEIVFERSGDEITESLRRIGKGSAVNLTIFKADGRTWFVVTVNTDPDDEYTESAVTPGEKAKREHWQRANVILSVEHTLDRALWVAEHSPMDREQKTLWFERMPGQYRIGPVAPRHGASGRPEWAEPGYSQQAGA